MSTIAEPPASSPTREVLGRAPLRHAEGLELLGELHGSGYRDGAALVRRADGQMVQLGPLQYGLLAAIDGSRDRAQRAATLSDELGKRCSERHVDRLARKLADLGLLAGTEHKAPPRRNPLLALRWKVLVTNPRITKRITAPFLWLFRPWVVVPVLIAFVAVCWFVLVEKGIASATAQAFHNPELILLVLALGIASAAFHEIGHASACRYGGGTPGGMGMGIYLVWPAFYTDVTDAYRLARRDRLRVDLGGLYFNAVIAVATMGAWLALRLDALLLLIGLQLLTMVKQLSPMIRADGYHILADATGVPDLFQHIGPTLRRLIPWRHREPSALAGRARVLVTAWVLVVVPILLSLSLAAVLLLPKLAASTWDNGHRIAAALPDQLGAGQVVNVLAGVLRLFALTLPVLGSAFVAQRLARMAADKARRWSGGSVPRRMAVVAAATMLMTGVAWAWWPAGQYQPVKPTDNGTLLGIPRLVSAPATIARPPAARAPVSLSPGKHLAIAMIPSGGVTKKHPAIFVIRRDKGQKPVVIVSPTAPPVTGVPHLAPQGSPATSQQSPTPSSPQPAQQPSQSIQVAAFPFKLPDKPGPHENQALAVNTTNGGVKYTVVYSLVTVHSGEPVDEANTAYALANCYACSTFAVSFQLVLIVGSTNVIAPINFAGALNGNCPYCVTTAIADQLVVTLKSQPPQELIDALTQELKKLDAISQLGAAGTPEEVAGEVLAIQHEIETDLNNSGLLNKPIGSGTSTTATPSGSGTDPTTTGQTTTPSPTPTSTSTTTSPDSSGSTDTSTNTTTTDTTTTTTTTDTTPTTTTTDTTTTDTTTTTSGG